MAFFKGDVYSYTLDKMTPIAVYLPQDDNKRFLVTKPQRTLVLLHGLEGNYSYWSRFSSVERYAQENNLALIMPDAEVSQYTNMRFGLNYESYIATELKSIVKSLFNVNVDYDNYYIAGLSMGGYGALKIGLAYPQVFSKIASFSGALMLGSKKYLDELSAWQDTGESEFYDEDYILKKTMVKSSLAVYGDEFAYKPENDILHIAQKAIIAKEKIPKILMTCGTEDFLHDTNIEYVNALSSLGIKIEYFEWQGKHMWKFWDESIQRYINFFD